ncbi:MAG TPA: mismatch-specific DNA-glycosylase [Kofleriaceae bacterium]
MPTVRDVVTAHPRILFVGINPGRTSGRVGHHFAGPGNPFWRLLHAAGLLPVELRADEDQRLVEFGLALVNVCKRPTPTAAELTRDELARGAIRLHTQVRAMQPEVVALVGVTLVPIVLGRGVAPGPGAKRERLAGARVFVLPNPSGLNASFPSFAAKLRWFARLRAFAAGPGRAARSPRSRAGRAPRRAPRRR